MIFVDGLECSNFDREIFRELREGGLGCVTVTCGFWEDGLESMDALVAWRDLVRANDDLVGVATTVAEIEAIHASGRTALLLGFQNSSFLAGRIGYVELFADLGVRVGQLTYKGGRPSTGEEDSGLLNGWSEGYSTDDVTLRLGLVAV